MWLVVVLKLLFCWFLFEYYFNVLFANAVRFYSGGKYEKIIIINDHTEAGFFYDDYKHSFKLQILTFQQHERTTRRVFLEHEGVNQSVSILIRLCQGPKRLRRFILPVTFNNYSPKAKWIFMVDICRGKYSPIFTEPEANSFCSIIFRGEYLERQKITLYELKHEKQRTHVLAIYRSVCSVYIIYTSNSAVKRFLGKIFRPNVLVVTYLSKFPMLWISRTWSDTLE